MTPVVLFIVPTAGRSVWLPRLVVRCPADRTMQQTDFSFPSFCLTSILIRDLLSLILLLHLPPVSSGPEWQLALGKPVRGRARRPTLPLLSDLAEHATALHRFGAAPRRQRGQVSSVPDAWILSKSQGVS